MSVELKLTFANADEALAFLSSKLVATVEANAKPAGPQDKAPGKSAKTAAPAASSPTAAPTPAPAAPETPPAASPSSAPDDLPYAPIGQRISEMVAVSNANSAANRTAIKAFFATLAEKYGTPVKTGQDVKVEDRPALVDVLDGLNLG